MSYFAIVTFEIIPQNSTFLTWFGTGEMTVPSSHS